MLQIKRKIDQSIIASQTKEAKSFRDRLMGLMFVKEMDGYDGILFDNCRAIHTHFMKFEMDAIFLDKNNKVIKIIRKMKPWRFSSIYLKANKVLELKGGATPESLQEGEELEVLSV
jgi:uncharacterized membrane protein (UPF0127 family)